VHEVIAEFNELNELFWRPGVQGKRPAKQQLRPSSQFLAERDPALEVVLNSIRVLEIGYLLYPKAPHDVEIGLDGTHDEDDGSCDECGPVRVGRQRLGLDYCPARELKVVGDEGVL
jgi:hypothetical protein